MTFVTTAGDFSDFCGHSWSLESVLEAESRPSAGAVLTWTSGGPPSSLMSSRWLWPSTTISFLKRPPAETTAASERRRSVSRRDWTDGGWWSALLWSITPPPAAHWSRDWLGERWGWISTMRTTNTNHYGTKWRHTHSDTLTLDFSLRRVRKQNFPLERSIYLWMFVLFLTLSLLWFYFLSV